MAELQLTLTPEESQYLKELLDFMLKETRIEEHRTRTLSYRQYVLNREKVIESLLNKLGQPVPGSA
jgi:hypothetical protein